MHTLPAVQAIREAYPHLKLRWLANTEWTPLLQGSPLIDEVIPFPRKQFRGLAGLLRFWNWRRTWMLLPREEPDDFRHRMLANIAALAFTIALIAVATSRKRDTTWDPPHIRPGHRPAY